VKEVHTPNPVEIDKFPITYAQITIQLPTGASEVVNLSGPTTVQVGIAPNGGAADTDGDGLDQVSTEMTQLDLQGTSSLGPVHVGLDPAHPTLGQIEEKANNTPGILDVPPFAATGTADSFFDVFYAITVGNQVFHPAQPVHMVSVITHKPPGPGDTYVNPFLEPVDLLDANGNPTRIKILKEVHTPNPIEIDRFPVTYAQITLALPNGGTEVVNLAGPTVVEVGIAPSGQASDSNGDGLDDVASEMTLLDLNGNSSLGPVHVGLDPAHRSLGRIQEQVNNTPGILDVPPFTATGAADSYFDVYYEIKVGNQVFHPARSLRMASVIHHKPPGPGDDYVNPFTDPVELLDANGNPTGIKIVKEVHTPNPVEIDKFPITYAQITIQLPTGASEVVNLSGPTTVQVGDRAQWGGHGHGRGRSGPGFDGDDATGFAGDEFFGPGACGLGPGPSDPGSDRGEGEQHAGHSGCAAVRGDRDGGQFL